MADRVSYTVEISAVSCKQSFPITVLYLLEIILFRDCFGKFSEEHTAQHVLSAVCPIALKARPVALLLVLYANTAVLLAGQQYGVFKGAFGPAAILYILANRCAVPASAPVPAPTACRR